MRLILTISTYLATLVAVAVATFFAVILLAGPHGGLLPRSLEGVVLILGWLLVLILPFWPARTVWRHLGKTVPSNRTIERDARKSGARPSL